MSKELSPQERIVKEINLYLAERHKRKPFRDHELIMDKLYDPLYEVTVENYRDLMTITTTFKLYVKENTL